MAFPNASTRQAQDQKSSKSQRTEPPARPGVIVLRPQFIDKREELPGGSIVLRFGLSKKDQFKHNAIRVESAYDPEAIPRPIEIIDTLRLTVSNTYSVPWSNKPIVEADFEIIEPKERPSIKIDGLPSATCQRIHDLVGSDPAANIPALEQALAKTKFSKVKRDLILAAFEAEAEARQSDTPAVSRLIKLIVSAGESRANARELAADFKPELGPFQFLFVKRQSFIKADRFAKLYDGGSFRDADRPMAIVVRQLLDTPHIVNRIAGITLSAWNDFEQPFTVTKPTIERLKARGIVREIDGLIGLSWLIEAEEKIANFLLDNPKNELTPPELHVIDYVLDHAAEILRKPGFVLTPDQRQAILTAFQYRVSIITGPPGVGKTAVLALINAIAAMLYSEEEIAAWVIALAGRAASNARWSPDGGMIPLNATTIHRALGLQSEGDDGPEAFKINRRIKCGVLGVEEASMNSSPLMAAIVEGLRARHVVFVGDKNQLPPIGAGRPFADMITAGNIPATHLTKNWRTDRQGIQQLCADMLTLDAATLASRFPDYVKAGGVEFVSCEWHERAGAAAMIFARLTDEGAGVEQIAILSPHKDGDAGCEAANLKTRDVLGFDPRKIERDDLLIVGRNNYHAPVPDDPELEETIYNGERCTVIKCASDYLDLEFPQNSEGLTRRVRLLMNDPDTTEGKAQLPDGVLFGSALSTHKAQGSQFAFTIVTAERGYKNAGVVQGSNVYTAVSRARIKVFIVGKPEDFTQAATTPEIPRNTLLKILLVKGRVA